MNVIAALLHGAARYRCCWIVQAYSLDAIVSRRQNSVFLFSESVRLFNFCRCNTGSSTKEVGKFLLLSARDLIKERILCVDTTELGATLRTGAVELTSIIPLCRSYGVVCQQLKVSFCFHTHQVRDGTWALIHRSCHIARKTAASLGRARATLILFSLSLVLVASCLWKKNQNEGMSYDNFALCVTGNSCLIDVSCG